MTSVPLPDGRHISYALDASPADAPIVLFSNSLSAPFAAWDPVVPALNALGLRTLRYDQPGHGRSSAPARLDATTFASLADDAAALLRALAIPRLHAWVGVSMGAATGIYFAARHPGIVRKLAVCDTISCSPGNAGVPDAFGPRVAAAREAGHMRGIVQGTLERWFGAEWMAANPAEAERMRGVMLTTTIDGFEACCAALRKDDFDLRPLLGKVGAGVDEALCVVGEKDANLPETMQDMRAAIEEGFATTSKERKGVELVVIKDAGHVCFIDGLEQFKKVMSSFLTS